MEIEAYGVLDDEFAINLRKQIRKSQPADPIELHISSPGGAVSAGVTAYNLLSSAPNEVHAYLDGDAFSAATLLVCAADYCEMPSNALMMIHEPWVPACLGTIDELEKTTKYLKATKRQATEIYKNKTGLSARRLGEMMRAETYLTAEEAQEINLVSNITSPSPAIQNMRPEDYSVRDRERLASMLGSRRIVRDAAELLKSIGV